MKPHTDLIPLLTSAARSARLGDFRDAASAINSALALLEPLLSGPSPEFKAKLGYTLETMMLMQQQQDWVAYADVIEYELIPLVKKYG